VERFARLEAKHNAEVRPRRLVNDVCLTINPTGTCTISYGTSISKPEAVVGVAMMFGVLALGWPGHQFRFRFPLEDDAPTLKKRAGAMRRDYRVAWRWAARFLIPDAAIKRIRREEPDVREVLEELGVMPDLLGYRLGIIIPPGLVGKPKEEWTPHS
jgi:hypothetical protein